MLYIYSQKNHRFKLNKKTEKVGLRSIWLRHNCVDGQQLLAVAPITVHNAVAQVMVELELCIAPLRVCAGADGQEIYRAV